MLSNVMTFLSMIPIQLSHKSFDIDRFWFVSADGQFLLFQQVLANIEPCPLNICLLLKPASTDAKCVAKDILCCL